MEVAVKAVLYRYIMELTGPVSGHDGGLASLGAVIDFWKRSGGSHPIHDNRIDPLNVSDKNTSDLESFLKSLSSRGLGGLVAEPRKFRPDG